MFQVPIREPTVFAELLEYFNLDLPTQTRFEPKAVGFFSINRDGQFFHDMSQLQLIKLPKEDAFPMDLTKQLNLRCAKAFPDYSECLDKILDYIFGKQKQFFKKDVKGFRLQEKIVCHIEVLQKLMYTPHESTEDWSILVSRFKDTIYMCVDYSSDKKADANLLALETVFKYVSHQNVNNNKPPQPEARSSFHYVFEATLDDQLTVLYSTNMCGAVLKNKGIPLSLDNLEFIECKLGSVSKTQDATIVKFSPKQTIMWWAECYLKTVKKLYVSSINARGCADFPQFTTVETLCQENDQMRVTQVGHYFLISMLKKIKNIMQEVDDPDVMYRFDYMANSKKIFLKKDVGPKIWNIIPDWYRIALNDE
ncbi:hypothetical protein KR018_009968 [Drosophila ironensis]|nr:hypothetical protein KR018_009968 [Drosophila ironensis]